MKVFKRDDASQKIDLPTIHLRTQDLVEVIEKTAGETPVNLTIGETFGNSYTILENIEEIRQHQASISIPFSFEIDGVETSFRSYGASIKFLNENTVLASSLEKRLSEFKPWFLFVFTWWFPGIWLTPMWLFLGFSSFQLEQAGGVIWFLLALWATPAFFSFAGFSFDRPKLYSKERQGFIRRNLDKILMLLLSLALGTLAANFDTIFQANKREPVIEDTVDD